MDKQGSITALLQLKVKGEEIMSRTGKEATSHEVTVGIVPYVLGGRSKFCIMQGDRKFWFSVKKAKYGDCYFVSGAEGSSRNLDYLGGIRVKTDMKYGKTPISYFYSDECKQRGLEYLLDGLYKVLCCKDSQNSKVHVYHDGRCSVCGRALTDFESIQRGIGPTCIQKIFG